MEFNEKLQHLRKKNELTQEALAKLLFVSRAAVSKWESGRGYPNIDSLKGLSNVFDVSIDDLLSTDELIVLAGEDKKDNLGQLRNIFYALLDTMSIVFFIVPLFGQKSDGYIKSVSLLNLRVQETYILTSYTLIISISFLYGVVELVFQKNHNQIWKKYSPILSISISIIATVIFIVTQQPYIAFLMLWILIFKGIIYLKKSRYQACHT